MPSLEFAEGFIFSEELIRTMLQMVHDSCLHNIEYGTYLCKKRGLIYPDIICKGTDTAIRIKGYNGDFIGKFHTHPRASFDESMHDNLGMLQGLVQTRHHIECIYGFKDSAIKCVEYACTPEEGEYILKNLPKVTDEDSFKVKLSEALQKLTINIKVYTIAMMEDLLKGIGASELEAEGAAYGQQMLREIYGGHGTAGRDTA